ncbi:unnamed protein product [Fraxinus pennsylvanica]|uniref:Uncharacterized protein n=1 Tax=Fraxinus pennsylvanica TaxID=56036 RepID=A0AAD2ECV9_9LAMI|nr:unnamed protein product [Fraxinus pennsylvanica]
MAVSSTIAFSVKRCKPELVVPAKSTPREIKKLSDIDDQEGLRFQVPMVFFYKNNPSMKGINPVEVIREGLAKALVYYYPFAGRIMEGDNRKLMVDCNGEGVLFVEADAYIRLEQLGDNILPPWPFMEEFLHDVSGSGGIIGCPLLLFQVTRFICGGFALGIRYNHTMADAYGMMQFLNAISELEKGASTPSILPVWQREQYLNARYPPRITCIHHEYEQIPQSTDFMDSDKLIRIAIFFTPKDIQALYSNLSSSGSFRRCSRLDLIIACLWKCRTSALNPSDPDETVRLSILTNVREKGASAPSILPVWQREQYFNARSPPKITCIHHEYEQITQSTDFMDSDKLIRTAVFFTSKDIQALYNHLSSSGNFRRCSRFDLIVACLWKCRTNALNPSDPDETVRLSIFTNVRGKPGLNLPTGYYVQLIQNAKAQMSEEYIKSVADLMVIKKRPKYATDWNFIVSNITRLGFEKIDFGWGNAVYGGVASATSNISVCTNIKNGKGEDEVVVPLFLPPLAVEKFKYELEKMTCEPLCKM